MERERARFAAELRAAAAHGGDGDGLRRLLLEKEKLVGQLRVQLHEREQQVRHHRSTSHLQHERRNDCAVCELHGCRAVQAAERDAAAACAVLPADAWCFRGRCQLSLQQQGHEEALLAAEGERRELQQQCEAGKAALAEAANARTELEAALEDAKRDGYGAGMEAAAAMVQLRADAAAKDDQLAALREELASLAAAHAALRRSAEERSTLLAELEERSTAAEADREAVTEDLHRSLGEQRQAVRSCSSIGNRGAWPLAEHLKQRGRGGLVGQASALQQERDKLVRELKDAAASAAKQLEDARQRERAAGQEALAVAVSALEAKVLEVQQEAASAAKSHAKDVRHLQAELLEAQHASDAAAQRASAAEAAVEDLQAALAEEQEALRRAQADAERDSTLLAELKARLATSKADHKVAITELQSSLAEQQEELKAAAAAAERQLKEVQEQERDRLASQEAVAAAVTALEAKANLAWQEAAEAAASHAEDVRRHQAELLDAQNAAETAAQQASKAEALVATLQAALATERDTAQSAQASAIDAERRLADLASDVEKAYEARDQHAAAAQAAKTRVAAADDELAEARSAAKAVAAKLAILQEALAASLERERTLQEALENANQLKSEADREQARLSEELSAAVSAYSALQSRLAEASTLDEARTAAIESLEAKLAQARQAARDVARDAESERERLLGELVTAQDALAAAAARFATTEAASKELRERLEAALAEQRASAEAGTEIFQRNMLLQQALQEACEAASVAQAEVRRQLAETAALAEKRDTEVALRAADAQHFQDALDKLQELLRERKEELTLVEAEQVVQLRQAAEVAALDRQALERAVAEAQARLAASEAVSAELRTAICAAEDAICKQTQVAASEEQVAAILQQLAAKSERLTEAEAALQAAKVSVKELSAASAAAAEAQERAAEALKEELCREADLLRQQLTDTEGKLASCTGVLQEGAAKLDASQQQTADLCQALEVARGAARRDLEACQEAAAAEMAATLQRLQESDEARIALEAALQEAGTQVDSSDRAAADLQLAVEMAHAEVLGLQAELRRTQAALATANETLTESSIRLGKQEEAAAALALTSKVLQAETAALAARLEHEQMACCDAEATVAAATAKLCASEAELAAAEQAVGNAKALLLAATADHSSAAAAAAADLQAALEAARRAHHRELDDAKATATALADRLQEKNVVLDQLVAEAQRTSCTLIDREHELVKVRGTAMAAAGRVDALQREAEEMAARLQAMEAEVKGQENYGTKEEGALSAEAVQLDEASSGQLQLERKVAALDDRNAGLAAQLVASKALVVDLEADLGASKVLVTDLEVALASAKRDTSNGAEAALQLAADKFAASTAALAAKLSASEVLVSDLQVALVATERESSDAKHSLQAAMEKLECSAAAIAGLQASLEAAERARGQELDVAKASLVTLTEQLQEKDTVLERAAEDAQQMRCTLAGREHVLKELHAAAATAAGQRDILQQETKEAAARLCSAEVEARRREDVAAERQQQLEVDVAIKSRCSADKACQAHVAEASALALQVVQLRQALEDVKSKAASARSAQEEESLASEQELASTSYPQVVGKLEPKLDVREAVLATKQGGPAAIGGALAAGLQVAAGAAEQGLQLSVGDGQAKLAAVAENHLRLEEDITQQHEQLHVARKNNEKLVQLLHKMDASEHVELLSSRQALDGAVHQLQEKLQLLADGDRAAALVSITALQSHIDALEERLAASQAEEMKLQEGIEIMQGVMVARGDLITRIKAQLLQRSASNCSTKGATADQTEGLAIITQLEELEATLWAKDGEVQRLQEELQREKASTATMEARLAALEEDIRSKAAGIELLHEELRATKQLLTAEQTARLAERREHMLSSIVERAAMDPQEVHWLIAEAAGSDRDTLERQSLERREMSHMELCALTWALEEKKSTVQTLQAELEEVKCNLVKSEVLLADMQQAHSRCAQRDGSLAQQLVAAEAKALLAAAVGSSKLYTEEKEELVAKVGQLQKELTVVTAALVAAESSEGQISYYVETCESLVRINDTLQKRIAKQQVRIKSLTNSYARSTQTTPLSSRQSSPPALHLLGKENRSVNIEHVPGQLHGLGSLFDLQDVVNNNPQRQKSGSAQQLPDYCIASPSKEPVFPKRQKL
eukprot:SM000037S13470  [mRNA]  locus=s37:1177:9211:- [translate_table: standard]